MRSDDVTVGRRVFLGLLGLGGVGIVFGAKVERMVSDGSGLGGLPPAWPISCQLDPRVPFR